jgi:hypothetical protein
MILLLSLKFSYNIGQFVKNFLLKYRVIFGGIIINKRVPNIDIKLYYSPKPLLFKISRGNHHINQSIEWWYVRI